MSDPSVVAAVVQSDTGLTLVRHGVLLQLTGLVWGMVVSATPFPKLALTAHIQFMAHGAMTLLAGLLLRQSNLIELSPLQSRIVGAGFSVIWAALGAECLNAYWGTNQILPIAAAQAGAKGAPLWQEQIMTATHLGEAVALIGAFGILAFGLFSRAKGKLE